MSSRLGETPLLQVGLTQEPRLRANWGSRPAQEPPCGARRRHRDPHHASRRHAHARLAACVPHPPHRPRVRRRQAALAAQPFRDAPP